MNSPAHDCSLTLDKNQDGKLSEDEVTPGGRTRRASGRTASAKRSGIMRMMKALSALDADEIT